MCDDPVSVLEIVVTYCAMSNFEKNLLRNLANLLSFSYRFVLFLDVVTIIVGHQTASPAPEFVKFTWQNVRRRMTTSFSAPFPNFFGRRI